jgi:prephenate dehydrogenase
MRFKQITVVGVGLLGASLIKAIHERKLSHRIVGLYHSKRSLRTSKALRIPGRGFVGLPAEVLFRSDVILLALPLNDISRVLKKIFPMLRKGTLVMDVGSTKQSITSSVRFASRKIDFVGCHPMAGSEKKGARHSTSRLFENSICFVLKNSSKKGKSKAKAFWMSLGSKPVMMSASGHDRLVAKISHLPHLVANALMLSLAGSSRDLQYGGRGLKDSLRIAGSNPSLWTEIFIDNRYHVIKEALRYQKTFSDLVKALKAKRSVYLRRKLQQALRQKGHVE